MSRRPSAAVAWRLRRLAEARRRELTREARIRAFGARPQATVPHPERLALGGAVAGPRRRRSRLKALFNALFGRPR